MHGHIADVCMTNITVARRHFPAKIDNFGAERQDGLGCFTDMVSRQEISKQFGELLARRRVEARLSQRAFAKAVGLSRTSITNIERGRQPVSLPTLYVMADVLQRDVADLLPSINLRRPSGRPAQRRQIGRTSKESEWLERISTPHSGRVKHASN